MVTFFVLNKTRGMRRIKYTYKLQNFTDSPRELLQN